MMVMVVMVMLVVLVVGAHPVGLKQSPAKLLESHGVSINLDAIAKGVP